MITHTLHQLTDHVWWLDPWSATDRPTLGVIVGANGSLIVDAGASPAHVHALHAELQRHSLPAPRLVALTHWHWDHVFGLATLAVPALASHETQRIVQVMAGLEWSDAALDARVAAGSEIAFCRDMIRLELPDRSDLVIRPPEIAFDTAVTVDLGGLACRLFHVGGDHSPDGIVVHIPAERTAFIGDAIYPDLYHGPPRYTPAQLFPLLDRLLALECAYYLTGHDEAPLTRDQLAAEAHRLRTIGATVQQLGDDRAAVIAALDWTPSDDDLEIVDAFLHGLRMPAVKSPL
jgi:glyoxylase-like metal-dependent hydrolase (beta-lactamase superfamily II)